MSTEATPAETTQAVPADPGRADAASDSSEAHVAEVTASGQVSPVQPASEKPPTETVTAPTPTPAAEVVKDTVAATTDTARTAEFDAMKARLEALETKSAADTERLTAADAEVQKIRDEQRTERREALLGRFRVKAKFKDMIPDHDPGTEEGVAAIGAFLADRPELCEKAGPAVPELGDSETERIAKHALVDLSSYRASMDSSMKQRRA